MTGLMPSVKTERHDLEEKYTADIGEFLFTGIQALVRVPLAQLRSDTRRGMRTAGFISGYEGSPLGGYDLELKARRLLLETSDIVHKAGMNEELAATAVMGSQVASGLNGARYDGVLGVWYGKAPGLDRAGDAIRHANFAGTSPGGGVLALTGDDPGNKSSTLPSSSERVLEDLYIPTFFPGNMQEILDFGRHAIALSRACGLWSGVKVVTSVADGIGTAAVHPDRVMPIVPVVEYGGRPYVPQARSYFTRFSNDIEAEIFEARLPVAMGYVAENPSLNEITVDPLDAWIGVLAAGSVYYEVIEALKRLGLDAAMLRSQGVRLLRVGMLHPLDRHIVRRFARGLEEIMVVEEKRPYLEVLVRNILYGAPNAPTVVGKEAQDGTPLVSAHGALDAGRLLAPLSSRLGKRLDIVRPPAPHPAEAASRQRITISQNRVPFVCSGCPHSTGLQVPEGALVGAGIGCHGLVAYMDPSRVGKVITTTQMGGEGAQWIGIEPFIEGDHLFQNMGDGTYFHSGALAIRAAVSAGSHITFKILYNSAVAMTGGQDVAGSMSVPDLAAALVHEGVAKVIITTDDPSRYRGIRLHGTAEVWGRSRIVEAQQVLQATPGVTVLIHDQQCAAEKRRDRRRGRAPEPTLRVVINERVCEGCGDCGTKSNCLSVQPTDTEFGRKTQIHQSSCNKDYLCLDGDCPSFLTVTPRRGGRFVKASDPEQARRASGDRRLPPLADGDLPAPPSPIVPEDDFTVRMPGVGGTGVVAASQILGMAATLDGRHVWGLDQTGLSQKAGPVVSDLRISREPVDGSNKVIAGQVDTYLVFDLLVGTGPVLDGSSPERTVAIVATTFTPTGQMVTDVRAAPLDERLMRQLLDDRTRSAENIYVDAGRMVTRLFGSTTTANIFLLGVAHQRGALPLPARAIEEAIELNGAAVEANRLAFRWGRMLVVDPERVEATMISPAGDPTPPDATDIAMIGDLDRGTLGAVLRRRVSELRAYQNRAYARTYLDTVRRVAASEAALHPDSTELAETVARNLYKLMAYKDEYEVARLLVDPATLASARAAVGGRAKVSYNLHPPVLRAMGMKHKVRLGPWFTPVLRTLCVVGRLRGTPFDLCGLTRMRRLERDLIREYRDLVEAAAEHLTPESYPRAVELAGLPDLVRGYEDIKISNVERYRQEIARVTSAISLPV